MTEARYGYEAYLIEKVELVAVRLPTHDLQEEGHTVSIHRFEFAGLILTLLVRVEGKVPQLLELYLVQRDLCHLGLAACRHKRVEV